MRAEWGGVWKCHARHSAGARVHAVCPELTSEQRMPQTFLLPPPLRGLLSAPAVASVPHAPLGGPVGAGASPCRVGTRIAALTGEQLARG